MNLIELAATVQGFIQFIQFFLYVNQNNPVRHVIVALYTLMFYHYLVKNMTEDKLTMQQNCFVSELKVENNTHGNVV